MDTQVTRGVHIKEGVIFLLYLALLPPLIVGGIFDYKKGIIPNRLTIPLAVIGIIINIFTGNIGASLLGFSVSLAVGCIVWMLNGIGAGDVKLVAAIGAWLGLKSLSVVLFASSLVGLLGYVLYLIYKRNLMGKLTNVFYSLCTIRVLGINSTFITSEKIPFGTCIAIGYLLTLIFAFDYLKLV
jgi:prepilin peptidase CpaA